jgi:protein-disulfide isomerase
MPSIRYLATGALLMLIPVVAVNAVKQTAWGPVLAAPQARQIGGADAKVVIVEYSDFQCPSCARLHPTVNRFLDYYKGKVRFIYKYYPLTRIHPNAMPAAHAAECAADQKKFWPYADQLFATQLSWAPLKDATTSFVAIGQNVGLDMNRFAACYQDPSKLAVINADAAEAERRQVTATPTFFVGDTRLVGGSFDTEGGQTIEKALRQ